MKKPFVAIVDDDSAFSNYLRTFLSLRGYETRTYSRGDEVLAAIRQSDPPDIVLLDVMMPGLDGLATLRALKSARPETQAIMLSGREQASTIVEAVRLGAADYVVKPDDPEGLGEIALDVAIKNALEKNRLVSELTELRQQLSDDQDRAFLFWGNSEQMRQIANVIEHVADSDVTVLIRGESGVGKELVARAIHQRSPRRNKPLVKVNCAALPTELLESELFGHEKGAFTGAANTRIGKFEQADGGTLMLDEIAEMKPALQAKLLHVLQDGEFTRLGGNKRQTVDVRALAATNRDLESMMVAGDFREDLYYRLKVIEVTVPALRERRDEIPHLADFFIAKYARKYNRAVPTLSEEVRHLFLEHDWPGNIRELENMIKRLIILQDEQMLVRELRSAASRAPVFAPALATVGVGGPAPAGYQPVAAPPAGSPADLQGEPADDALTADPAPEEPKTLADIARAAAMKAERAALERTLDEVRWNRRKAAQLLGVSYKTLLNKIKECGISQK
ncbi:MAG TPA: sigma-54 dependent transcriptional regulator [Vicinamibacterales bacterium]|nr:sigma-54 dependent transcriptional regulator [Vicinamibacterales bacterium]